MNIMLIEWVDAESIDAWTEIDNLSQTLPTIKTVGFIVKQTKDLLTIALNYDADNQSVSCVMKIPNQWIKSKRLIKI